MLVLASASPRRSQLLTDAGIAFKAISPDTGEVACHGETPEDHVMRLAREKAEAVSVEYPVLAVLGADTVIALDGAIFGKPSSEADARRMLRLFSGRAHRVLTGVCIVRKSPHRAVEWVTATTVVFRELTEATIEHYCSSVNTIDKAGGYAIQELSELLVVEIQGSYSNVVGLPVEEVKAHLAAFDECGPRE